ncbi:MAG TPA: hypothetical protein PLD91_19500 [Spirochaetota bacterium]|nr:hypothetical protein [Spirochaetota bacterium]
MTGETRNPYALYVYCDGAMDYDSKNTGGVGFEIIFPESLGLPSIQESIGKYEGANIERLELEAIIQGMHKLISIFEENPDIPKNIQTIIFKTDRYGLNDEEKTSRFKIREWRSNKWHNHEGKAIKNSDLLDKINKTRKKISDTFHCAIRIQYGRRKFNKAANKLAIAGKKQTVANETIAIVGIKIGRRKFDNGEVDYKLLKIKDELVVRVYMKEPVRDQWVISCELCEENFLGNTLKIYTDSSLERYLHRHHEYKIRIKYVGEHHTTIFRTIKEVNKKG